MDIGFFTTWPAKQGEDEAACFENNFKEVRAADEQGWDRVWTASTPGGGVNPNPFVLSAAMGAMTSRILIGTGVHLLHNLKVPGESYLVDVEAGGQTIVRKGKTAENRSYTFDNLLPPDPIIIAQSIAMVDHATNGRFIYGVGGDTAGDADRRRHFLEFLDVMKSIWTQEDEFMGFDGEFYKYEKPSNPIRFPPKPVQKPYPPIMLACDSQQGFVPLGEMGYRVGIRGNVDAQRGTAYKAEGDAVLKKDVENYRKAYIDAGHAGSPGVAIRIPTYVAPTTKQAMEFREGITIERFKRAEAAGRAAPEKNATGQTELFGTPEEVIDRIHELQDGFGIDELLCELHLGNVTNRESHLQCMQLMTDKVLPAFK